MPNPKKRSREGALLELKGCIIMMMMMMMLLLLLLLLFVVVVVVVVVFFLIIIADYCDNHCRLLFFFG